MKILIIPDFKMGYRAILIALLKGMVFAGTLLIISLIIKFSFARQPVSLSHGRSITDTTFYFIGSSRVQRSISPNILKTRFPNYTFINLGVTNNSFLYNCQLASRLLQESKETKIIFIELAALTICPSDSYYFLLSQHDVWSVIRQHLSIQHTPADIQSLLFYMFSLHSDIKKIIYPELNLYGNPELGYQAGNREFKGSVTNIITPESFAIKTKISPSLLNAYLENINRLDSIAARNHAQIIFIFPLTISKTSELNIDVSVFAKLPESSKWSYPVEFMTAMRNEKYLFDDFHLNEAGANQYSYELSKFIKKLFKSNRSQGHP